MRWICADQKIVKEYGLPWAYSKMALAYPFDEHAKGLMLFDRDDKGMDTLIALVGYTHFGGRSVSMHVASDGSRRWMTRAFLHAVFDYPFNQLGVHRISILVAEHNADALRFDQHIGFKMEGRMREAAPDGTDMFVLGMLRGECRFLKKDSNG